jgi:hypothetical protein
MREKKNQVVIQLLVKQLKGKQAVVVVVMLMLLLFYYL